MPRVRPGVRELYNSVMDWRVKAKDRDAAFEQLKRIQTLTLTAIFSDDGLMERLVLKGGTAVDLIHGVGDRASIDLDFSMESDFSDEEKKDLQQRLERLLSETFRPVGLAVFDVTFMQKPPTLAAHLDAFWGGYRLEFKLIESDTAKALTSDLEKMRRQALRVGPSQNSKFEVEISRHEYCTDKEPKNIKGLTIYVYRPRLIVCEKLRAICQQMPEYQTMLAGTRGADRVRPGKQRARDFFDIYNLVKKFAIDTRSDEFSRVLRSVFDAKRASLSLLGKIRDTRAFHAGNFDQVRDTAAAGTTVLPFDTYFDSVVKLVADLEALGDEQPPAA
jgi:hypothetical protein